LEIGHRASAFLFNLSICAWVCPQVQGRIDRRIIAQFSAG
jgi:hypothetical protein